MGSVGMKKGLLVSFFLFSSTLLAKHVEYLGSFSQVKLTGDPACKVIFDHTDYFVKYFRLAPTGYKVLLHFVDVDPKNKGFLNGMTLAGYLGGSGDILVTNRSQTQLGRVELRAEGIVDPNVLFIEVRADLYEDSPGSTRRLCTISAEYLGD